MSSNVKISLTRLDFRPVSTYVAQLNMKVTFHCMVHFKKHIMRILQRINWHLICCIVKFE